MSCGEGSERDTDDSESETDERVRVRQTRGRERERERVRGVDKTHLDEDKFRRAREESCDELKGKPDDTKRLNDEERLSE